MASKQDLLTRLGAEIAEFVISNRGNEQALYADALRQLQMFRDALEYTPLSSSQVSALVDDGVTLADMVNFKQKYRIDGDTVTVYFDAVKRFVEYAYAENRLTVLRNLIERSYTEYLKEIKALPVDQIIERAGEIADRTSAVEHFRNLGGDSLYSEHIEALLTLDDPLKRISSSWPTSDSEDVDMLLFDIAYDRQGELEESRSEHTENPYVILYRQNYFSTKDNTPAITFAEHLEALKSKVEAEYEAVKQTAGTATRLHQFEAARAAYYAYTFDPIEVEVMLTYAQPLHEIINQKERHSTDYESAVICTVGERQAELSGYLARLDQLPEFLQGPVRDFKERCEAAQQLCKPVDMAAGRGAEYEPEQ